MKNNVTKGIILAGGNGTRLFPLTNALSKQLLPIYDKPMIYYPLSVLMLAKIKDILIISNPEYIESYKKLLKDGKQLGISISYISQEEPKGIAEAFTIGEEFIGDNNVALVLGDNLFYGEGFSEKLLKAKKSNKGASLFACWVDNPKEFGVVEIDQNDNVISIEEKPLDPKSNHVIVGLYFYHNSIINFAKNIKPSGRGELEISDINNKYLKSNDIELNFLGRGFTWLDTGSHDALLEAGNFVKAVEKNQGLKIACIEEISLSNGWISVNDLRLIGDSMSNNSYGKYLLKICNNYES